MSEPSPFQSRVLVALVAVLVVLFAASMLLSAGGGKRVTGSLIGSNTYSRSAVGHLGFFDVLRKLGYRAVRGEQNVLAMLGANGVLVLAEPGAGLSVGDDSNLLRAERIFIVLPKWTVRAGGERDGWIAEARLASAVVPEAVLFAAVGSGTVVRVAEPSAFEKTLALPDPTIRAPLQLVKNSRMKPLIATAEGILLGEFTEGSRRIWVLTDPDPIENHGIGKGDNMVFADGLVAAMLQGKNGQLVFDETLHGFQRSSRAPAKFLFEFPYNLIAIQILVCIGLLLMAAMGRFGAPEHPERVLSTGKRDLVGNAASLLDHAGYQADILRRYCSIVLQDAGRQLRAPRELNEAELAEWLDRAAGRRGVPSGCADLSRRVVAMGSNELGALLGEARSIHRWKKDMVDGVS
jgi:hypothetical protein